MRVAPHRPATVDYWKFWILEDCPDPSSAHPLTFQGACAVRGGMATATVTGRRWVPLPRRCRAEGGGSGGRDDGAVSVPAALHPLAPTAAADPRPGAS